MKLYLFSTSCLFNKPKLEVKEFEVEEKNKTYICNGRRFNKSDIGVVSGYSNNECLLLENDASEASSILIAAKLRELERLKQQVEKKEAEIENLKKYIKEK